MTGKKRRKYEMITHHKAKKYNEKIIIKLVLIKSSFILILFLFNLRK